MIKVFWVEDDIIMREDIRNKIEWERNGLVFAGEAGDGELALPLIKRTEPGILITDIEMPFMNGLELSRYVKKEFPDIKIIILSKSEDFASAQEALRIGAVEYLVKPVSAEQLLAAVKKTAELVEIERQKEERWQVCQEIEEERLRVEGMRFFKKLIMEKTAVSDLLEKGQQMGMELIAQKYNIILIQLFSDSDSGKAVSGLDEVQRRLKALAKNTPEVEFFEGETGDLIFLLKEAGERSVETLGAELEVQIYDIAAEYSDIRCFIGNGKPVARLSEMNKCFEQAKYSLGYAYLEPRKHTAQWSEAQYRSGKDEDLELSAIEVNKLDRKSIEAFLKTGLRSEVLAFVEDYFASVGEDNMNSCIFRQYVALDMCFAATGVVEQLGYEGKELMERCGNVDVAAASFAGVKETKDFLRKMFEEVIEMRESVAGKKYRLLLQEAKNYIQQNFSNEEISLNSVAASINLSPNHFSSVFRQETGQTFIEYLTSVRMEKARELLRGTSMKTAEIAQAVGYKDSHYFSYLFKKTQECTPRDFRSGEEKHA